MLNSVVLDVAIGLVFVYLVLSLMSTAANEWIAQLFEMRAKTLKQGIEALLHSPPVDPAAFQPAEINPSKLLMRLMSPGDKLARALGLDPSTGPGFVTPASTELPAIREALAQRLNSVLSDPQLYAKIDVGRATEATMKRAQKQSAGQALALANAALLRESYPLELGSLASALFNHPLIQSISQNGKLPSYISPQAFSAALTDILAQRESLDAVRVAIGNLPDSPIKQTLVILAQQPSANLAEFERQVQTWFDDSMDRVSGWYKRKVQWVTVIVAAIVTIWANADTVVIARKLFLAPAVRQKIVQDAATQSSQITPSQMADLGELTGWSSEFITFHKLKNGDPKSQPDDSFPGMDLIKSFPLFVAWLWGVLPGHLLGWVLTMTAVSLGAPFWFDTLNKFMNVRSAGTAPNEKGQDKSKA